MKHLLRKKWVRRLIQSLAIVISLGILCCAGINWWGARQKRAAIAAWKAAGRPLTLSQMLSPWPPEDQNFAMLPIFVTMRQEYESKSDPLEEWGAESLCRRMEAMGKLEREGGIGSKYFKSQIDRAPDFSEWADANGFEGDAPRLLSQFDAEYGDILADLRAGLNRPFSVPPRWYALADDSDALFKRGQPIYTFARCVPGLVLRTELALSAERPEVALESLKMACRLSDLVGAEHTFIGMILRGGAWSALYPALAKALAKGVWTEQEIASIRTLLVGSDELGLIETGLDLETLANIGSFSTYRKDRAKLAESFGAFSRFYFTAAKTPVIRELVPAGWHDAFLARAIRRNIGQIGALPAAGTSLLDWCRESAAAEAKYDKRGELARALLPNNEMGIDPGVLRERMSFAIVMRAQAVLAADLELFRKKRGTYPVTLDELPGNSSVDPMTGQLFRYRSKPGSYVLYSVGLDGTDHGGNKGDERHSGRQAPDWVW